MRPTHRRVTRVTPFQQDVVAVVNRLPPSVVVSYAWVAHKAGYPGRARAVGGVLGRFSHELPWWRVAHAKKTLVDARETEQARLLRAEGVETEAGRLVHPPLHA